MRSTTLLKQKRAQRRKNHVRRKIRQATTLPRLSVNRTSKHISAQVIDDVAGRTLCAVSSTSKSFADQLQGKTKSERAAIVGAELGRRAKDAGIEQVAFDRGSSKYHGRVKAFADAVREAGVKF